MHSSAVFGPTIGNIGYFCLNSLLVHFLYSWAGLLYVEAQVSRINFQTILDKMDSGVIILESETM